jgi:hypothetical protein
MLTAPMKRQTSTREKSITGGAVTDRALWRLSLVLKEIAESTNAQESVVTDNKQLPSGERRKIPGRTTGKLDK